MCSRGAHTATPTQRLLKPRTYAAGANGEGQWHLSAQKAANWAPSQLTASDNARVCAFASAYRSVSSRLPNETASPGKAWLVASQYSMMPVHLKVLGSMQMSEFETRDSKLQLQAHRHCLQGSCDACAQHCRHGALCDPLTSARWIDCLSCDARHTAHTAAWRTQTAANHQKQNCNCCFTEPGVEPAGCAPLASMDTTVSCGSLYASTYATNHITEG